MLDYVRQTAMDENDPTLTQAFPEDLPATGKYRITGRLGQGGMGVVYRAIDRDLGRTVALKLLPWDLAAHPDTEQRFLREARAASALDHVNIGTIYGVEETEDHRRFIVMACYEGQNLSARMQQEANRLSEEEAVGIAVQVARGLAAAHAKGVIHRDIKPSNILLTPQGVIKIVDFGLASMADADQLTQTGARMGTPAYMSPEQALGGTVDHRADIWSLGVMLCEMLTGEKLFRAGSAMGVMYNVVHGELDALEKIPPRLRPVLTHALQRDANQRFQCMEEFLSALERREGGGERSLTFESAPKIARPNWRFTRRALAGVLLITALGAVGAGRKWGPWKAATGAQPDAVDKYRRAITLTKRWDKDGNLAQAIALLTEATRLDPGFAPGFARLAEAQRVSYALSHDQKTLDAAVRNADEAFRLNNGLSIVHVARGRLQAMRGSNDLAFASFQQAVHIDPNDPEAHQAIARQYERQGRSQDAETAYQRAILLDPESISIRDSYANFLFRANRYPEAIREWEAIVREAPDHAPAYTNLGSARSGNGDTAEALAAFERAVAIKPNYMVYNNLGTVYTLAGRYPESVGAYRKALELNDQEPLMWGNLATVYSWMPGMNRQSAEAFQRAIELAEKRRQSSPRDADVHADLALYYAKSGQSELAITRLGTALALSPKGSGIQVRAAEVEEILGHRAKAAAYAIRALELGFPLHTMENNADLTKLMPIVKTMSGRRKLVK